eukprot:7911331-Karenia_brevis.AAC.1
MLLSFRERSGAGCVCLACPVTQPVVAKGARLANLTRQRVPPVRVKRLQAQSAVAAPVLAPSSLGTNPEPQPPAQANPEVR